MRASTGWVAGLSSLAFVASFTVGCSSSSNNSAPPPADETGTTVEAGPADTGIDATPPVDAGPTYPPPPYGLTVGAVFPLVTLSGYKDGIAGDGTWVPISTSNYYDPTGSKGFTGIYFVDAAQWCEPCNNEAYNLGAFYSKSYKARGAVFATVVIQKSDQSAATQAVVDGWMTTHQINFDAMLDPNGIATLPQTGSVGLPHNYVIDPRTMKITTVVEGYDPYIVKCGTGQPACCSPDQNTASPGCCDPSLDSCQTSGSPCPCPVVPSGGTAADVTWTCNATVGFCIEPDTHGAIPDLETVMIANGAMPLVP